METKWYTIKVQSNREKSISDKIKFEIERGGNTANTLVPTERQYFAKNGKKAHREKIIYPGYIFVETESLASLQEAIKLVPGSTGVLKSKSGEPSLLKKDEIEKLLILANMKEDEYDPFNFVVGEEVTIVGGPFNTFKGTIDELNKEKRKVKVSVMIFGRATPVDLTIDQITKLD